ncbi:MAG: glycoside hydrolase family 2 [Kiritimatiellae bacterium]|nr:glycoside hydrolase family 2 [Kiritimatiellia bacterium]
MTFALLSCGMLSAVGATIVAAGPWEMSQATAPEEWMPAVVPGTALTTLVKNGKVPDPYWGLNNRFESKRIPDLSEDRAFYEVTYRTTVELPASFTNRVVWMRPEGVNYRSEIYLNGTLAASTRGMFARNAVDVTPYVKPGAANALVVKVWPVDHPGTPQQKSWGAAGEWANGGDGAIGRDVTMLMSVGWDFTFNDGIRDRNTGIWRPIVFFATDKVRLDAPYVRTKLNDDFSAAELTLEVDLHNATNGWGAEEKGRLVAEVEGTDVRFEKELTLFRGERRTEFLTATLANPKLWWPRNKGPQNLYTLKARFVSAKTGAVSDETRVRFGVREVTSGPTGKDGARQFFVNRRPVFIRGTNWIPEAMLKADDARMEAEVRLTYESGVNLVRLWAGGIPESDRFYELCDEYGLLVWQEFWMTGDTCHPDDPALYLDNVAQQVKRIRPHASVVHYVASNESTEVAGTEELVKRLTGTTSWMMQSECDGVHDGSPYFPVNPMSYYEDTASPRGSRVYGFSPEYGTCALPPAECCRAFMPEELLWPIERNVAAWKYREGGGFDKMTEFHHAYVNGYGVSKTFDEYARKSQAADALAHRCLWETWNRARNEATGVLFWYNNTPIPQLGGHMWDYSLVATASQFAQANALEPLHAQYEYLSNRVSVVSDVYSAHALAVRAEVYDFDSRKVWEKEAEVKVEGEGCLDVFAIPFGSELTFDKPHFIKLRLFENGAEIASTFYWRSNSRYEGAQTVTGPCVVGFEELDNLPRTTLVTRQISDKGGKLVLEIANTGTHLAFMTEVRLEDADGKYLKPVFFSDNFFALLPGVKRHIEVVHPQTLFGWKVKAWNSR